MACSGISHVGFRALADRPESKEAHNHHRLTDEIRRSLIAENEGHELEIDFDAVGQSGMVDSFVVAS